MAKSYEQLNTLQLQVQELRAKNDAQQLTLETLTKERDALKQQLEKKSRNNVLAHETVRSQQELIELQSQATSLKAANEELNDELTSLRSTIEAESRSRERQADLMAELQVKYQKMAKLAGDYERKLSEQSVAVQDAERKLEVMTHNHNQALSRLKEIEDQASSQGKLLKEKREAEAMCKQLKVQLDTIIVEAARQHHNMQNSWQSTRHMLEELKLEYERFAEVSRLEAEMARKSFGEEYQRLREQFEDAKLRELEATQAAHREQQLIVEALQSQFEEYRATAESIFLTEARRLEERLNTQVAVGEAKLLQVIKTKNQQFVQMVTAKDAKIMNLLDGTNLQKILVKHELELEQLRKQHERDTQMVREICQSEHRHMVEELQSKIREQDQELDKARHQALNWENKLRDITQRIVKQKEEFAMREDVNRMAAEEMQSRLNVSFNSIEKLTQEKENLRHKILRLRLQVSGEADNSNDSLAKRLSTEARRLGEELASQSARLSSLLNENDALRLQLEKTDEVRLFLTSEVDRRTVELRRLVHTFEQYLAGRVDTLASYGEILPTTSSLRGPATLAQFQRVHSLTSTPVSLDPFAGTPSNTKMDTMVHGQLLAAHLHRAHAAARCADTVAAESAVTVAELDQKDGRNVDMGAHSNTVMTPDRCEDRRRISHLTAVSAPEQSAAQNSSRTDPLIQDGHSGVITTAMGNVRQRKFSVVSALTTGSLRTAGAAGHESFFVGDVHSDSACVTHSAQQRHSVHGNGITSSYDDSRALRRSSERSEPAVQRLYRQLRRVSTANIDASSLREAVTVAAGAPDAVDHDKQTDLYQNGVDDDLCAANADGVLDRRTRLKNMMKALKGLPLTSHVLCNANPKSVNTTLVAQSDALDQAAAKRINVLLELEDKNELVTAEKLLALDRGFELLKHFKQTSQGYTDSAVSIRDTRRLQRMAEKYRNDKNTYKHSKDNPRSELSKSNSGINADMYDMAVRSEHEAATKVYFPPQDNASVAETVEGVAIPKSYEGKAELSVASSPKDIIQSHNVKRGIQDKIRRRKMWRKHRLRYVGAQPGEAPDQQLGLGIKNSLAVISGPARLSAPVPAAALPDRTVRDGNGNSERTVREAGA